MRVCIAYRIVSSFVRCTSNSLQLQEQSKDRRRISRPKYTKKQELQGKVGSSISQRSPEGKVKNGNSATAFLRTCLARHTQTNTISKWIFFDSPSFFRSSTFLLSVNSVQLNAHYISWFCCFTCLPRCIFPNIHVQTCLFFFSDWATNTLSKYLPVFVEIFWAR